MGLFPASLAGSQFNELSEKRDIFDFELGSSRFETYNLIFQEFNGEERNRLSVSNRRFGFAGGESTVFSDTSSVEIIR
jgi:hypothetical protein